jgi:hypothetical protein
MALPGKKRPGRFVRAHRAEGDDMADIPRQLEPDKADKPRGLDKESKGPAVLLPTPKPENHPPRLLDSPSLTLSNATGLPGRPRREENDAYPTVANLNARWRVIECKNSIQWILQRRCRGRWNGKYFCRTREALLRFARAGAGEIAGDALVILLRLPERFPEGRP